jgi:hypothetical protein
MLCNEHDLRIKQLMNDKKKLLQMKAEAHGLSTIGTKMDLSIRIAEYESKLFTKTWEGISDG